LPVEDLGFDVDDVLRWFSTEHSDCYTLVRVDDKTSEVWAEKLAQTLRRCYAKDALVEERVLATGLNASEVMAALLPSRGSIKAGDFGEFFAYLYQAAEAHPEAAVGPKKWRMKANSDSPAPGSDVVQFLLPSWPTPSDLDVVVCAEVKTKSTDREWSPIKNAIDGCRKDRTSRLATTLVWLRDRAVIDDVSGVDLDTLNRFVNADAHPPAEKRFRAIALVETDLLESELEDAPDVPPEDYSLIIIAFSGLYDVYNEVFGVAAGSLDPSEEVGPE